MSKIKVQVRTDTKDPDRRGLLGTALMITKIYQLYQDIMNADVT